MSSVKDPAVGNNTVSDGWTEHHRRSLKWNTFFSMFSHNHISRSLHNFYHIAKEQKIYLPQNEFLCQIYTIGAWSVCIKWANSVETVQSLRTHLNLYNLFWIKKRTMCVWPLKHTPEIQGLTFLAAVLLFKVSCLPAPLVSKAVKDIKGALVFHFQGSCKCPYLSIIHTRRSKSHCWHLLYITWYLGKASRKSVTWKGPSLKIHGC